MANVLIFRQKNLISDADTDVPPPPWPPHSSVLLVHPVVCPVHPVSAVYWEGRGYITLHLHHGPPLPTHATCSYTWHAAIAKLIREAASCCYLLIICQLLLTLHCLISWKQIASRSKNITIGIWRSAKNTDLLILLDHDVGDMDQLNANSGSLFKAACITARQSDFMHAGNYVREWMLHSIIFDIIQLSGWPTSSKNIDFTAKKLTILSFS